MSKLHPEISPKFHPSPPYNETSPKPRRLRPNLFPCFAQILSQPRPGLAKSRPSLAHERRELTK